METTEYNQASIIIIVKNVKKYLQPYDFLYYSQRIFGGNDNQTKAKKIEAVAFIKTGDLSSASQYAGD